MPSGRALHGENNWYSWLVSSIFLAAPLAGGREAVLWLARGWKAEVWVAWVDSGTPLPYILEITHPPVG